MPRDDTSFVTSHKARVRKRYAPKGGLFPRILAENVADTPITVVLNWWAAFVDRPP